MRRNIIGILVLIVFCGTGYSQSEYTQYTIRDFKHSLVLGINGSSSTQVTLNAYGEISSQFSTMDYAYLFQGQEYDQDLSIYFFPSRLYAPRQKRFLQPDPRSQYHSPYSFVGGDPVNIIDQDGNEGKPLILYADESRPHGSSMSSAVAEGMQKDVDGYYHPIADFVNGDVPIDFPDWNGNIFIESHTENGGGIASEYYHRGEKFKLRKKYSEGIYEAADGNGEFGFVRHSSLSERLAELSSKTGVPIKNVTFGGCEGGVAAKKLRKSIGKTFRRMNAPGGKISVKGMSEDAYSGYMSGAVRSDIDGECS